MVILDLACQTECTLCALRLHPHHSNLAFEFLFQMLSIRIMSWDFEGADNPFPGGERYTRNTIKSVAAQVPGEAFHCFRPLVAEQQEGPMQVVTCSFPALLGKRILQFSRLTQTTIDCRQFQRVGGHEISTMPSCALSLPSSGGFRIDQSSENPIICNKPQGFSAALAWFDFSQKNSTFTQVPRVLDDGCVLTGPLSELMLRA